MAHEDQVRQGLLVPQKEYIEQVRLRNVADKESERLKGEIEELTSSLFDEANKMVASANRETSVWGRKINSFSSNSKNATFFLKTFKNNFQLSNQSWKTYPMNAIGSLNSISLKQTS